MNEVMIEEVGCEEVNWVEVSGVEHNEALEVEKVMNEYPRTIQQLVDSEWFARIHTAVRSFRLKDTEEDLVNDVIIHFAKIDYLNRWNPSKGSFSNWMYTGVNNLLRKKWAHEHTVVGTALRFAVEMDKPMTNDSSTTIGMMIPDFKEDSFETLDIIDEMKKVLSNSEFAARSSNTVDGVTYNRDMLTVFTMMVEGFDVKEIAEKFATSVQFVYTLVNKIKEVCQPILA